MDNPHKGHRKRLRERFLQEGLDGFTDVQAVELLLQFGVPRRDTNVTAHELLSRFGGFRGLMEADYRDLRTVDGVGDNCAALLALIPAICRFYRLSSRPKRPCIRCAEDAAEQFAPLFDYATEEKAFMLCLNTKAQVVGEHIIGEGLSSQVHFALRDVIDFALRDKAEAVILAHNHPNDIALPSASDVETTKKLAAALNLIGVELRDHLIFAGGDAVSLKDSGYF